MDVAPLQATSTVFYMIWILFTKDNKLKNIVLDILQIRQVLRKLHFTNANGDLR